jgi:exonuclease VII large subunit
MLDAVSPLATLARGYSIVRKDSPPGGVVTDYRKVAVDDMVEITLHRGYLRCIIEKTGESRLLQDINGEVSAGKKSIDQ